MRNRVGISHLVGVCLSLSSRSPALLSPTALHPAEQVFVGYNVMTYPAFFKADERLGRPFESWSGALSKC